MQYPFYIKTKKQIQFCSMNIFKVKLYTIFVYKTEDKKEKFEKYYFFLIFCF